MVIKLIIPNVMFVVVQETLRKLYLWGLDNWSIKKKSVTFAKVLVNKNLKATIVKLVKDRKSSRPKRYWK